MCSGHKPSMWLFKNTFLSSDSGKEHVCVIYFAVFTHETSENMVILRLGYVCERCTVKHVEAATVEHNL